ncbi:ATP-binding protein [Magnetospirillum sp. SS-4]|uniref:ATP-binding protein n=1 Tax=Magnetospirillum sp. SS-4 TaxID=2681465 RepID=UPI0013819CEF|nr:ATP-binding protein [Magnetospirillum sp. SS-4]CAA7620304.1 putative two-component sensor histidine kinase, classical system [Magnetospirillum sp. SS-4]
MPADSLRRRLILGAGLWLALALAAGGAVLGHAFRDSALHGFRERLGAHLRSLTAAMEVGSDGAVDVIRPVGDPRFEQPYSGWYWQISDGAEVRVRSRSLWDFALPVSHAAIPGALHARGETGPRGEALEVVERDIVTGDDGRLVHVAIAASRAEIDAEVGRFDLLLAVSLGGLGLGLMAAVALQVGYGLRPLGRLAGELDGLRRRGGRIKGDYPAEVAPLVGAMNEVLDHDARLIERARTHVGNLAHGLKTPLAVLEVELSSPKPDRAVLVEQLRRLGRMVDIHLGRARAQAAPAEGLGDRVAVAEVAGEIAAALRRIHAGRGLAIEVDCAADALFAGSRDDLAEILGNLMDNACKWAAGRVLVTARAAVIVVEDDGPGLSPDQANAAVRRGARLDESAPGSGLGLSIVADLCGLLGLSLDFSRSGLGGLRVEVGR